MVLEAAGPGGLPPFSAGVLFSQAHPPALATLGLLLVAAVYLWGVRRLTARGDRWPVWRTLVFIGLGLGTIAMALLSGLATYDETLFSAHMVQHMMLSMVAPVFLALGAPVTLALRTLPRSPRSLLLGVLHSRVVKVFSFPAIPWLLFVGSPFALYFSGWYPATLQHPWLHALLHVHLLAVGCLFFWPILGIDPVPGRVSHPFRILMLFATLPFHAFLGIAIMSVDDNGGSLISAEHYVPLLGRTESIFQQQLGGGLLWASGDLVGLLFLSVVLVQWMQASEREAVREDRHLDRLEARAAARAAAGEQAPAPALSSADERADAELAAYNARLAQLHGRSGGATVAEAQQRA